MREESGNRPEHFTLGVFWLAARLLDEEFSEMRAELDAALDGADAFLVDLNNRGVSRSSLYVGPDRFTPAWRGATRLGLTEQLDWVLLNPYTLNLDEARTYWTTSDHLAQVASVTW